MTVIDTHTHLDYFEDPDSAIADARAAGVSGMVSIGCGVDSITRTLEIAQRNSHAVRVAVGVHPQAAAAFDVTTFDDIAAQAQDPLVVAIGETGFDQYRDYGSIEEQLPVFQLHCELARSVNKPLVIHTRAAEQVTLDALERHAADLEVILHCYSLTDPDHVAQVRERGYWCSFAGNVTYPSAGDLRAALRMLDPSRILVETDAPYLAPVPRRGTRNHPAYVVHTLGIVASELGLETVVAAQQLVTNSIRACGLPAAWAEGEHVDALQCESVPNAAD
jgi:TatD DNase family protein